MTFGNGGHFVRHLGFWKELLTDCLALFVSHSTNIPTLILKISACYELFKHFDIMFLEKFQWEKTGKIFPIFSTGTISHFS